LLLDRIRAASPEWDSENGAITSLRRWAHPNHLAIRCIVPLLDNNRLGVNTLLPFAMAIKALKQGN
jgi:hypothetical protein